MAHTQTLSEICYYQYATFVVHSNKVVDIIEHPVDFTLDEDEVADIPVNSDSAASQDTRRSLAEVTVVGSDAGNVDATVKE